MRVPILLGEAVGGSDAPAILVVDISARIMARLRGRRESYQRAAYIWNRKSAKGASMSPGVYYLRVAADPRIARKVVYIR